LIAAGWIAALLTTFIASAQVQDPGDAYKARVRRRIQEIMRESLKQGEGEMILDGVRVIVRTKMPPTQKANDEILHYGDDAVPILAEYLESGSERERETSVWFLGMLGYAGARIRGPLRRAVQHDSSSYIRERAIRVLLTTPWDDAPGILDGNNEASSSPFERLVEVAKRFKIPMGIERVDEDGKDSSLEHAADSEQRSRDRSALSLIEEILKQMPGYQASVADGIVLIARPDIMNSDRNFLNLRIPHYEVSGENVYGAEFQLRIAIARTLEPEKYARGYNGGYGHPPGTVFGINNISIKVDNATVREIMSEIIRQNGHGIWTVHLAPANTKPEAAYFAQDDWPTPGFQWRFIPLDEDQTR
jgi:hypothetical protein